MNTWSINEYVELMRALNDGGWCVTTHAVGDAAIDLVLDAYEAAHADRSIADRRWVIEHGFISGAGPTVRMHELNLLVSAQNRLHLAAPSLVSYGGSERAECNVIGTVCRLPIGAFSKPTMRPESIP